MCGEAYCAPFGCVVGKAIEHVGGGNIIAGLCVIFLLGTTFGYVIGVKRANAQLRKSLAKESPPSSPPPK